MSRTTASNRTIATHRTLATNRTELNQNFEILSGQSVFTTNANLVINGNMELDSNWTNYNLEGGETNERSSVKSHGGLYSRHIVVDGTGEGATSDNLDIVSGKTYRVTAWVFVVSGVAYIRRNSARIDFNLTSTTTGAWEKLTVDVVAGSTGTEKVRLESSGGGAEYYVDDISVVDLGFVSEDIGNFEDITGWTVTGTGASISADTTNKKVGSQALKITSVNAVSAYAISPSGKYYDFSSTNLFSCWLYIDDVSKLYQSGFTLFLIYTGSTDYFSYSVTGSNLRTGWNRIVFKRSDCAVGNGNPSWVSPVTQIRIRTLSLSGQTVNMTVDDFRIGRYERPKVIVTFDDGNATDYTEAFAYMQPLGLKGVCYVPGENVGATNQITLSQMQEMYSAGWDMGNHSYTHVDLTTLTEEEVKEEIRLDAEYLINNGMPRAAYMLAWPFSALNDTVMEWVRQAGIVVARTGANGINSHERQEKLKLYRGSVSSTMTVGDLTAYVDTVVERGGLLIYNFHDIRTVEATTDVTQATFRAVMDYLKVKVNQGVLDVVTISEWYDGLAGKRTSV